MKRTILWILLTTFTFMATVAVGNAQNVSENMIQNVSIMKLDYMVKEEHQLFFQSFLAPAYKRQKHYYRFPIHHREHITNRNCLQLF